MSVHGGPDAERSAMRSLLFDQVDNLLLITDSDGTVLDVNDSTADLLGFAGAADIVGRKLASLFPESQLADPQWFAQLDRGADFADKILAEVERDDGAVTFLDIRIIWSGAADRIFLLAHDVSEQIRESTALSMQVASLTQMAYTDVLTGLPNRLSYEERIAARPSGEVGGWMVFLDVDDFKGINDTFGHPGGDLFLAELGARLRANIGPAEFVARIGGDEFVVLFPSPMNENTLRGRMSFLFGRLRPRYELGEDMYRAKFSAGASFCPEWMETKDWVNRADKALYSAKSQRGTYCEVAEQLTEAESEAIEAAAAV